MREGEGRANRYQILNLKAINRAIENHSPNAQGNKTILRFIILLEIIRSNGFGSNFDFLLSIVISFDLLLSALSIQ